MDAKNSDYATADIEPLRYIQTAVTRLPIGATGPLGHDLRVGVEQALRLDDRFGSIEAGNGADLVEIGADPMTVAPSTIAAIQATRLRGMRFARA